MDVNEEANKTEDECDLFYIPPSNSKGVTGKFCRVTSTPIWKVSSVWHLPASILFNIEQPGRTKGELIQSLIDSFRSIHLPHLLEECLDINVVTIKGLVEAGIGYHMYKIKLHDFIDTKFENLDWYLELDPDLGMLLAPILIPNQRIIVTGGVLDDSDKTLRLLVFDFDPQPGEIFHFVTCEEGRPFNYDSPYGELLDKTVYQMQYFFPEGATVLQTQTDFLPEVSSVFDSSLSEIHSNYNQMTSYSQTNSVTNVQTRSSTSLRIHTFPIPEALPERREVSLVKQDLENQTKFQLKTSTSEKRPGYQNYSESQSKRLKLQKEVETLGTHTLPSPEALSESKDVFSAKQDSTNHQKEVGKKTSTSEQSPENQNFSEPQSNRLKLQKGIDEPSFSIAEAGTSQRVPVPNASKNIDIRSKNDTQASTSENSLYHNPKNLNIRLPAANFILNDFHTKRAQVEPLANLYVSELLRRKEKRQGLNKQRRPVITNGNYEYHNLKVLNSLLYSEEGTRKPLLQQYNVYGVVDEILVPGHFGAYKIRISDETWQGVLVRLHPSGLLTTIGPAMQVNDIIRIHRATVQEELSGYLDQPGNPQREMVISATPHRSYTLFNYSTQIDEEPEVSTCSATISITAFDKQRIQELRRFIESNFVRMTPNADPRLLFRNGLGSVCPYSNNSFKSAKMNQDWMEADSMDDAMRQINSENENMIPTN